MATSDEKKLKTTEETNQDRVSRHSPKNQTLRRSHNERNDESRQ
jgi:hypothetical protein